MRATSSVSRNHKKSALRARLKGCNRRFKSSYTMGKTLEIKRTTYQFVSRKLLKRQERSLWIMRINAALRQLFDISYSKFMALHNKLDIKFNRKILADLCFNDLDAFKALVAPIINPTN